MAMLAIGHGSVAEVGATRTLALSRASDETLRSMKAEHLKAQADEAVRQGNFGVAVQKYTECLSLHPGGKSDARLLSNRALALSKAGKHSAAAVDALRACDLEPGWHKAWFRLGSAQLGAGNAPAAVDSFAKGLRINPACRETRLALRRAIQRLTREEIAAKLLRMLDDAQARGWLVAPTVEDVDGNTKQEAMFRHMQLYHRDKPPPGDYYDYLLLWMEVEWTPGMAYIHRSQMYHRAKCYSQAAADAVEAIRLYQSCSTALVVRQQPHKRSPDALMVTHIHRPGTVHAFRRARVDPLAWAWFAHGEALKAEKDIPARDLVVAASCFVRALDLDPDNPLYGQKLADVASELNQAQLCGVLDAVYLARDGQAGQAATLLGMSSAPQGATHRCVASLRFPQATAASFSSATRRVFIDLVAAAAQLAPPKVLIERVRPPGALSRAGEAPALEVSFQVHFGDSHDASVAFAQRIIQEPAAVLGGIDAPVCQALGVPDAASAAARSERVALTDMSDAENPGQRLLLSKARERSSSQAVIPVPPAVQLELPYSSYRLVRADGRAVERVDKHPFQLSRVFYDAKERPEQVWAELRDGSCRWRQSAGEVAIIALRVPPDARKHQLEVSIDLHHIRVACKDTGRVYLAGELERGIVPDESVWAHGGGAGDDGFVFFLRKMNLELLAGEGGHEATWWPRLFVHHTPIAWDDYEKDYSDLPAHVMEQHRLQEHKSQVTRAVESADKSQREAAQERDDARRRRRQERLHVLRGGQPLSWVELDRLNPAVDTMPQAPMTPEGALLHAVRHASATKNADLLNSVIA